MGLKNVLLFRGFWRLEIAVELMLSDAVNLGYIRVQRRYHRHRYCSSRASLIEETRPGLDCHA